MARTKRDPNEPLLLPFTIVIDSREQAPFLFTGIIGDSADKFRPLIVPTVMACLQEGDYSIAGSPAYGVALERKSAQDCFSSCVGENRERFEEEHRRLAAYKVKAVIIESDWPTMFLHPPGHTRLSPGSVFGTGISWFVKYGVPWYACPGRRFAELMCFRLLRKFYEENRQPAGTETIGL